MDKIITESLQQYPLLLLSPIPRRTSGAFLSSSEQEVGRVAQSLEECQSVPEEVWHTMQHILRFWEKLLRNASSKALFQSVEELVDLLACSRDEIADLALAALHALSLSPVLYKQSLELHQHPTQLQAPTRSDVIYSQARLVTSARGYGSRDQGTGLYQLLCPEEDAVNFGNLTAEQREELFRVQFQYYSEQGESMQEIKLSYPDLLLAETPKRAGNETSDLSLLSIKSSSSEASKKRKRGISSSESDEDPPFHSDREGSKLQSTASLFFLALSRSGTNKIPTDRLFALLTDIRLCRSLVTRQGRIDAVNRRLRALICILQSIQNFEILSGYFTAQPELCVELIDLLRPTISSANVATTSASQGRSWHVDGIARLSSGGPAASIPFDTRILALEALNAVVSRRDGSSSSGLSGSARLSTILGELGVGKGQYLGMLPTLIRYSLASLGSVHSVTSSSPTGATSPVTASPNRDETVELGLAFLEATSAPLPSRLVQVENAMEIIDNVLTLTSAVQSAPGGTSALTECGLIPTLLTTISMDTDGVVDQMLSAEDRESISQSDLDRVCARLRFVMAHAVQILEAAFVAHNNALAAFNDLQGVQVLTARLCGELGIPVTAGSSEAKPGVEAMDVDTSPSSEVTKPASQLLKGEIVSPSRSVLLFSIVTCLTIVFHQDASTSTAPTPAGGTHLREKGLTDCLIHILDNVELYGGPIASLIATLLSDVMNNEPHVVHHVHKSGLAGSFLRMIMSSSEEDGEEPMIPVFHELIMAIPNVIAALSLTEDGAKAVEEMNPFPNLLRIFYHPKYAMPQSRCLLNEMTAIVGTGFDEIMRHVDKLKPLVVDAIVKALENVAKIAEGLARREEELQDEDVMSPAKIALETVRTCVIQYTMNFCQMLEQVLQQEDHCESFVDAGGLDALLSLFPASLCSNLQFLTFTSCLSSPSISTLHHSTIEESVGTVMKLIESRYDASKLITKIVEKATFYVNALKDSQAALFRNNEAGILLSSLPSLPIYRIADDSKDRAKLLGAFLKNVAIIHWITNVLATSIKEICQRNVEVVPGGGQEREWKKTLASEPFNTLIEMLSAFFRSTLFDVCRERTEEGFDKEETDRLKTRQSNLRYRLRIVCPEGAIVRDGIEIDSCANVGSMEMGEIVEALDRCINSSGILRYRTARGWISEMTRGHGREPIAEVIHVHEASSADAFDEVDSKGSKRSEAAVPNLRTVALNVLARGQAYFSELLGAMSKLSIHGLRSSASRAISQGDGIGEYVAPAIKFVSQSIEEAFNLPNEAVSSSISRPGLAMYYGCILNILQACLFDDKRDRLMVNLPLLISVVSTDQRVGRLLSERDCDYGKQSFDDEGGRVGLFGACGTVFDAGLADFAARSLRPGGESLPHQRVGRSTAASFPSLILFLRRILSTLISSSPLATRLSRVKWKDLPKLLGRSGLTVAFSDESELDSFFEPERFASGLRVTVSLVLKKASLNPDFSKTPPHLIHPVLNLIGDIIGGLEDVCKQKMPSLTVRANGAGFNLSDYFRHRRRIGSSGNRETEQDEPFEPDEAAITQLAEMGFDRDRAIDALENTRSNRVEIAMEYALNHAPPSPGTIARRRAEREERRRRREDNNARGDDGNPPESVDTQNGAEGGSTGASEPAGTSAPAAEEEEMPETKDPFNARKELDVWIEELPPLCCTLLSAAETYQVADETQRGEDGNGEVEALAVVVSSFLLDLCNRYPKNRFSIASSLFSHLKAQVCSSETKMEAFENTIADGSELAVSAVCHAAVLFMRAIPKSRIYLLKENVVGPIIAAVQTMLRKYSISTVNSTKRLPQWLAPCLLLLDIMAQPAVGFDDEDVKETSEKEMDIEGEYGEVKSEHKYQAAQVAELGRKIFSIEEKEENPLDANTDKKPSPFNKIPAYYQLLPRRYEEPCLDICFSLLGTGSSESAKVIAPPGVAHATLLLLLRLLRSPTNASKSRRRGLTEAILGLSSKSKFTGNTGVVALIFRRLLEDETSLQNAMEMEIRAIMSKLVAGNVSPSDGKERVKLRAFVEAVTPLLCRDSLAFLRAMAATVKVVAAPDDDRTVRLLTSDEKSKITASLGDVLKCHSNDRARSGRTESRQHTKSKGKSPHKNPRKNSLSRKHKKEKQSCQKGQGSHSTETPAAQVTSLLINSIIVSAEGCISQETEETFLWTGGLIEVLTDLVLSSPACASAVHNYRPHRSRDKEARNVLYSQLQHALPDCPNPSKSFVSFLLHSVLPHDRWSLLNDPQIWDRKKYRDEKADLVKTKRRKAYRVMKLSQAAARVILVLVARPGEGRKRVISDLAFALSGGTLAHGYFKGAHLTNSDDSKFSAKELHALEAWGELCVAIAAPRASGRTSDNQSSLNIENVRLLLDNGMVHALTYALHRVKPFHPMAPHSYAVLLASFECLTRSSVADAVSELVKKYKKGTETGTLGSAVDADANMVKVDNQALVVPGPRIDTDLHVGEGSDSLSEDSGTGDDTDSHQSDEDLSSENESMEEDDEETSSDSSDGTEMDEDSEDEGVSVDQSEDGEVEDNGDWDMEFDGDFIVDRDGGPAEAPEVEDGSGSVEWEPPPAAEEGWTRIESSAFGGMLVGGRGTAASSGGRDRNDPSRGFIEAAEAMIGTLFRNGEISNETMAELEGTLGIMRGGNRMMAGALLGSEMNGGARVFGEAFANRMAGTDSGTQIDPVVTGTVPHVHQRTQPDVGYSTYGSGGSWTEVSPMEFVYGGLSVTAGNREYDLVTPIDQDTRSETHPPLSQMDVQLFPGGPASTSIAVPQHSQHPLLCGVDLPPINSLVADLMPHGARAARYGQMTTSQRPGDWTNNGFSSGGFLVSTSTGSIIRASRLQSGAQSSGFGFSSRQTAGPVGWTDDGIPVYPAVGDLSSAFERALTDATAVTQNAEQAEGTAGTSEGAQPAQAGETDAPVDASGDEVDTAVEGDAQAANEQAASEEGSPTDGDRVASSLAEGLRLSPGGNSDASTTNLQARNEVREEGAALQHAEPPVEETNNVTGEDAIEPAARASDETTTGGEVGAGDSNGPTRQTGTQEREAEPNANGLVCPPDVDPEVFNSLPLEMQQDCVNQYNATQEIAAQVDGSSLDPEVLAALPEEMRREVIEQDRRERQLREESQANADPSQAEEMDNANFIASLSPDLRDEILVTADDAFLSTLPPNIVAEAQILRERASAQNRRSYTFGRTESTTHQGRGGDNAGATSHHASQASPSSDQKRKKVRCGKIRVDCDRADIVYTPETLPMPVGKADLMLLVSLMYLVTPIRSSKLPQKVFQNLFLNPSIRGSTASALLKILEDDNEGARRALERLADEYKDNDSWRRFLDESFSPTEFPPSALLGTSPEINDFDVYNMVMSASMFRRKPAVGASAAVAASLPSLTRSSGNRSSLPPIVAGRVVDTLLQLCKSSPRFCLHLLVQPTEPADDSSSGLELLLDLLNKPMYSRSSANLDHLLSLVEAAVSPLSHIAKHKGDEVELSQRDLEAASAAGKEWADVPRIVLSQTRLQILCSILRMETCRDSSFAKINTIVRRLCRVEQNRGYVLTELASVASALGADAIRDLRSLKVRLDSAASQHQAHLSKKSESFDANTEETQNVSSVGMSRHVSSMVPLSTSSSEIKLLRVLQTLQALCGENWEDSSSKKPDGSVLVTRELLHLLRQLKFDELWDELSSCLAVVQVLEGVKEMEDDNDQEPEDNDISGEAGAEASGPAAKKLRNSVAGLLTRFLPSIEAFFICNASATRSENPGDEKGSGKGGDITLENMAGGQRVTEFVAANRVLLNALVRNNAGQLDKGLRALVQVPRCRVFLDFDVKRQWFKTQVRRLRQHASRRHGSLRLHIRRKYVFEDTYHQLRLRNTEEMRGRLHITFRNEEGVDAGGLSREFFAILAKEMFNPNYALFTSTEDGCTFQPNPNSSINPDHLSYFRFVGRIVGKAVADGYLLDAHFTRSLYKHMLGMKPTHHDMEAIDPDYYRNLKTILEYKLADIGLDLTFSIEDHSFGRSQTIDLIPNGRTIHVTEENKEEYVRQVCQHRMTTAIQSQIQAYLDGFHELVSPDLIAIFTPRELELLISGLPDIDVHDLKKNTDYVGWRVTDKEIGWFWNILFSLSRSEKASFLQFVTGSSKVPLAGFSELQGMRGVQKFSIHKQSGKSGALMSAHTCFNSLDLPTYQSEEEMREKLLYAINEGGGAFLFA